MTGPGVTDANPAEYGSAPFGFPAFGGAMGAMIGRHDWAATPIGAIATWPVALKTLVEVMLGANQPMFVAWGAAGTLIYNGSYVRIIGMKHPGALGRPFLDVWPEIRADLLPLVETVTAGTPVQMDDIMLMMERHGYPEETHFTFSYTPIRDSETGAVAGFFCACSEITDQVMTQRRQLETEADAREVLEGMGEGFVLFDRDFRIQRINAEGLRIARGGPDDIVGRHLLDAWPEVENLAIWPWYQALMRDRMPGQMTYHYPSEDDEQWVELHAYPSRTGLAVFYRDVTGAKRAEAALRESEAQFRALAQAVPNHAWTARPDGNLDWFNRQVFIYSGLDFDTLAGQGWARIVHPDDLARAADTWARSLATGAPYEIEFRIRRFDGAYRWHLIRARAIRGGSGAITQWVGTNTDIEDQRIATTALAALNADLERRVAERTAEHDRVWRNSRDLLLVVGADGVFRAVNPAWTTILGHRSEEVVGRSFLDFVWPDDAALTQSKLETAVTAEDLTNFENRYRHKDGSARWLSWHTSVEGDMVYAYGRDITAEKEQAEALRHTEEALRQSQKMEAVGQLTGGLAHDFNNLLTGITGSLELLQMRVAQGRMGDLDRYFAAAQGAARRAAALTHRLLAFSRRQTLDPKATDVNRLIAGMEDLIRRTAGPAVAIEVVGAMGLWTTMVDPNQLENALLNLCINARDAMPDGGRLTIETGNRWMDDRGALDRELPAGQYISLCVSDTGTGMTPEVMRRAFDPFFTTKPIGLGTGLGLSMIYGFVRQSGGQARIYSEPGRGTMVCLYLPRHRGDAPVADPPIAMAVPPRAEDGQTVLVVDDEPTVRMLVSEVLRDHGYTPVEAGDGPAALRMLESAIRVDLLITDVGLPGGINGRQLADAARILRPALKVLFITGYAENAVVRNGYLDAGMHVLTKPFTMDGLASRLADIIGDA
jgi:PAS domain S-box-containing protein